MQEFLLTRGDLYHMLISFFELDESSKFKGLNLDIRYLFRFGDGISIFVNFHVFLGVIFFPKSWPRVPPLEQTHRRDQFCYLDHWCGR